MPLPLKIGRGRGFFKKTQEEKDQFLLENRLRRLKKGEKRAKKLEDLAKKEQDKIKVASEELATLLEEAKKKYPAKK